MRYRPLALLAALPLTSLASLAACSTTESPTGRSAADGDASTATDASVPDVIDAALNDAGFEIPDSTPTCDPSANACVLSSWSTCEGGAMTTDPCSLGCSSGGCNTTCDAASVVIDQATANDFTTIAPWQSFEVAETGVLTQLDLRPNVYSASSTPSSLTLSIYVGEGVVGTRIAQQTYVVPSASGSPLTAFAFTTPIPLQAAQRYTWELTGAKGIHYASSDVYPNGRASVATYDMVFKAHVQTCR